jgi:hypothetical protein
MELGTGELEDGAQEEEVALCREGRHREGRWSDR